MKEYLKELEDKLNSMSQEEFDKEWEELEKYNVGPTIEEYFKMLKLYNESNIS